MMFETPTPPTSSEIAAMAASTRVSSDRIRPIVPRICVWVTAENSSPAYLSSSASHEPSLQVLDAVGARRLHRERVDAVDAEQALRRGDRDVHLPVAVDPERRCPARRRRR